MERSKGGPPLPLLLPMPMPKISCPPLHRSLISVPWKAVQAAAAAETATSCPSCHVPSYRHPHFATHTEKNGQQAITITCGHRLGPTLPLWALAPPTMDQGPSRGAKTLKQSPPAP
jgi:hypothetical protein